MRDDTHCTFGRRFAAWRVARRWLLDDGSHYAGALPGVHELRAVLMSGNGPVQRVVRAWLDEGPQPEVHRAAKWRMSGQWPTLFRAIEELVAACDDPPRREHRTLKDPTLPARLRALADELEGDG